jgi:acyl-CoA synthetase (NDP forming)
MTTSPDSLTRALDPVSIVIIGASDDPNKVGGRPLFYLSKFGFRGRVYPVNARRTSVQGWPAFPSVTQIPEPADLAVIALPAESALAAVDECATMGVGAAIVMSAGFAEAGPSGAARQARMVESARAGQMRLVGPNSQGLANFGTGAVASFSTAFLEIAPADGPVGIISQSGIMSVVPYALLRRRGIGVRHTHAIGNSADVTLAELALAVLQDATVRLLLLYLETMPDPHAFATVADLARERDVAIIALKTGRTVAGQAAARSHTAALASEDRVVDAFFRHHAVWRAADVHELVNAAELYLKGWRPDGSAIAAVSNSGATCVMLADSVADHGLSLAPIADQTKTRLKARLPDYAHAQNPLDVTGALLNDSSLIGDTLAIAAADAAVDLLFVGVPVAGQGYDVSRIAADAARVSDSTGKPVVLTSSVAAVLDAGRRVGLPVFERDRDALAALAQLHRHRQLQRRVHVTQSDGVPLTWPVVEATVLDEAHSLSLIAQAGLPVVPWLLCDSPHEASSAFRQLGGPVVAKGCAFELPHKTEHALVALDLRSEEEALAAFHRITRQLQQMGVHSRGVLFASFVRGWQELALGGRVDAQFGPVILVGTGGTDIETHDDVAVLLPPVTLDEVADALGQLKISRVLRGTRARAPSDIDAYCKMAVALGEMILANADHIRSIDLNPVLVGPAGKGALVADAVIVRTLHA